MNRLWIRNDANYRLARTIIQGIIAVIITNLDLLIGTFSIPAEYKPMMTAIIMAILSPIMAHLGTNGVEKEELPEGYFEDMEEDNGDSEEDA